MISPRLQCPRVRRRDFHALVVKTAIKVSYSHDFALGAKSIDAAIPVMKRRPFAMLTAQFGSRAPSLLISKRPILFVRRIGGVVQPEPVSGLEVNRFNV